MKYRGTIAFDDEPEPGKPRQPDRRDKTRYLLWKRAWREKNHERLRIYNREYYRKNFAVNSQ